LSFTSQTKAQFLGSLCNEAFTNTHITHHLVINLLCQHSRPWCDAKPHVLSILLITFDCNRIGNLGLEKRRPVRQNLEEGYFYEDANFVHKIQHQGRPLTDEIHDNN
jgi:hypothetical protein